MSSNTKTLSFFTFVSRESKLRFTTEKPSATASVFLLLKSSHHWNIPWAYVQRAQIPHMTWWRMLSSSSVCLWSGSIFILFCNPSSQLMTAKELIHILLTLTQCWICRCLLFNICISVKYIEEIWQHYRTPVLNRAHYINVFTWSALQAFSSMISQHFSFLKLCCCPAEFSAPL